MTRRLGNGPWHVRAVATAPATDVTASGCHLADEAVAGAKGSVSATLVPFSVKTRVWRVRLYQPAAMS